MNRRVFLCPFAFHLPFACRKPGFQIVASKELELPELDWVWDKTALLPKKKGFAVDIKEINDMRDPPIFFALQYDNLFHFRLLTLDCLYIQYICRLSVYSTLNGKYLGRCFE